MYNPMIYVYKKIGDERFDGTYKIGYTESQTIKDRIDQQEHAVNKPFKTYEICFEAPAIDIYGNKFMDKDVHKILKEMNCICARDYETEFESEYFYCELPQIRNAYMHVKHRQKYSPERINDFKMRQEQIDAVNQTIDSFKINNKFLWNAKMRFGKTFTSYQLALKMDWKKVLVVTFKPAVENEWRNDLLQHTDFEGWQFNNKNEEYHKIDQSNPYICFRSLQDLLGTTDDEIKERNEWIHLTQWDCIIFDEYHFGAWRENTKELFQNGTEETDEILLDETQLKIQANYFLYLSGTPFRAISSGEFKEEQIFNWTYPQEQEMKKKYIEDGYSEKNNPYAQLPQMKLLCYELDKTITEKIKDKSNLLNGFNLGEFFKAEWKNENKAEFKNKDAIVKWLDVITGKMRQNPDMLDFKKKSNYPFENIDLREKLLHTLWFMPDVASCYAMNDLLKQHTFFKDYAVKIAAGDKIGNGAAAKRPVEDMIRQNSKTITLSCGKLTTGVTIKEWSGIFMLRNVQSPETYFQSAFRVQSPWKVNDEIIKHECYVFDFAPDRALQQVKYYCDKMDPKVEKSPRETLQEFINYLPILVYNGAELTEVNVDYILNKLMETIHEKKWDTLALINSIDKINDDVKNIIMAITKTNKIKNDSTEINNSDCLKGLKSKGDNSSVPNTDTEKLSTKEIMEKLRNLTAKLPLFLLLSNKRELSLNDIIDCDEPELFTLCTGILIEDFKLLVKHDIFNKHFINYMIYNFAQIEKESENYF